MENNSFFIPRIFQAIFFIVQIYVIWKIFKHTKKVGGIKEIYKVSIKGASASTVLLFCFKIFAILMGAVGMSLLTITVIVGPNEFTFPAIALIVLSISLFAVGHSLS